MFGVTLLMYRLKQITGMQVAADAFVWEVEANSDFQQHPAPVVLRQRWRDAGYLSAHERLNGQEQLDIEMDLARQGNADAQRYLAYRRLIGLGVEEDINGTQSFTNPLDNRDFLLSTGTIIL